MISPVQAARMAYIKRTAEGGRGREEKSARHLPVDPIVNFGGAEPPELSDMNPSDAA
jgi:hypothetical protein